MCWYAFWWSEEETSIGDWPCRRINKSVSLSSYLHILHADLYDAVVLVDECTSGVDPLSRRALWKNLTACREDRCIVFTTHVGVLIHVSRCKSYFIFNSFWTNRTSCVTKLP